MPSEFEDGFLVGILVGEGHFGGDGRQPHVTLRMHDRHGPLFRWLERTYPGGRLYGPYEHGGRRYYQWMARGAYLRDVLAPLLRARLTPEIDRYAHDRFYRMIEQYGRQLGVPAEETREYRVETVDMDSGSTSASASRPGPGEGRPSSDPTTRASKIFAALRNHQIAPPNAAGQGRPSTSSNDSP